MFQALGKQLAQAVQSLVGSKVLTKENTKEAISKVRFALLDADVHIHVVKKLLREVEEKALTTKVIEGATAGETLIKMLHDEMILLMQDPLERGEMDDSLAEAVDPQKVLSRQIRRLKLQERFSCILFCGLQASGKTTQVAKLAAWVQKHAPNKKILVGACDLQRPKAREQLQTLCDQIGVDCHRGEGSALEGAQQAMQRAKSEGYDLLLIDTAGRLYLDPVLMEEAGAIKESLRSTFSDQALCTLFVASAAMGQDVAKSARSFHEEVGIDGSIMTMLDGDARAGGVLSITEMTGAPILFEGVGEKMGDLQPFSPRSMADRILGMGDTINLMRKLSEHIDEGSAKKMGEKLLSASFTYEDYLSQMQMVNKMGSLSSLMQMIPGMSQLTDQIPIDEKSFKKTEAMILSMTPSERKGLVELIPSRRRRIAKGSGVDLHELNRMIKSFAQAKKMLKGASGMGQMQKMLQGSFAPGSSAQASSAKGSSARGAMKKMLKKFPGSKKFFK